MMEKVCATCANEPLDVRHPTCYACIYEQADNYDEKRCDNCRHIYKDMMEHPCVICNQGGGANDDDFLWESPYCIPEIPKIITVEDDNVNHPSHYTQGGIECIDAMTSAFGKEAVKHFCICNAFKYVWRSEHKNGIEDIDKAIWYLNKVKELSADE